MSLSFTKYKNFSLKDLNIQFFVIKFILDDDKNITNRLGIPKTIRIHTNIIGIGLLLPKIWKYWFLAYLGSGHFGLC